MPSGIAISSEGRARVLHRIRGKHTAWTRVLARNAIGRDLKSNEVVHHVDNNPENDNPNNLVICSRKYHDNIFHRHTRSGGRPPYKLTWADTVEIKRLRDLGWYQYEIADVFDIHQCYVSRILNGKRR